MNIDALAKALLKQVPRLAKTDLCSLQHLAGDASGREYHRLLLSSNNPASLILLKLHHGKGPIVAGEDSCQDDTFVELSAFLRQHDLPVPAVTLDARKEGFLLIEDAGDAPLWRFVFAEHNSASARLAETMGEAVLDFLYPECLRLLARLQSIENDPKCIAFRRKMSVDVYREESRRFIDMYAAPRGFPSSTLPVIGKSIDALCECMAAHPTTLVYRDFNAWNIHIDADRNLRLIDFQDLLLGSDAYDLMSLLHDRDIDLRTGRAFIQHMIDEFGNCARPRGDFRRRYLEALLQRHFRLSGQFEMLSTRLGRDTYRRWIPGCFRRIASVIADFDYMADTMQILSERVPEFREGLEEPWKLLS